MKLKVFELKLEKPLATLEADVAKFVEETEKDGSEVHVNTVTHFENHFHHNHGVVMTYDIYKPLKRSVVAPPLSPITAKVNEIAEKMKEAMKPVEVPHVDDPPLPPQEPAGAGEAGDCGATPDTPAEQPVAGTEGA